MNGPTMCRRVNGNTRPTSKPPRSRRRWSMISMRGYWGQTPFPSKCGLTPKSESPLRSKRLQVLREIVLLATRQPQREVLVVVVDHIGERREAAVVIEAALHVRPEAAQRRRTVAPVRRARRLEIIDADFLGRVHVPARLGVERRHVTAAAIRLAIEQRLAT